MRPRKSCVRVIAPEGSSGLGGAFPINPVIAPFRPQLSGQCERLAGLLRTPQLEQRAAEAEQRVVVGRRAVHDGLELDARGLELARAEVRPAERLADRRLLRLEPRRLGQRDGGLVELPGLEERGAALEQVVYVVHLTFECRPGSSGPEARPTRRAGARS